MPILRGLLRFLLGALFLGAARDHFVDPRAYEVIVPPPLPAALCVRISGILELLGGLLLWGKPRWGAWLLTGVLIAVFPANVYMAWTGVKFRQFPSQPWMAWARLALQPVLIALIWWSLPRSVASGS